MDYSKESNAKKKRAAVSKAKKAQNRIVTVAFRAIAAFTLIIIFAVGGTVFGAYVGIIESAPSFELGDMTPTNFNSTVYDMYGNQIWSFHAAGARRIHAPFEAIPEHLINAFVAIEDERFFQHHGVDVRGTLRAVYVSFIARTGQEG
ncbi:MAG: transglycosylase domain-containing protein, partial [Defluviitaleaceae bacterium]|nr:transglycosylase domain-containing protein [Defluviitaleaceae bacterium]